jgi:glycogen debranching enzyme
MLAKYTAKAIPNTHSLMAALAPAEQSNKARAVAISWIRSFGGYGGGYHIMEDIIRLTDNYYIVATASTTDEVRVLKQGDSFGVFDRSGDIQPTGLGEQGIYHEGTRFLSLLTFRLGNLRPFLLSSTIKKDNLLFTVNLTNPDVYVDGNVILRRGDLHIFRTKFIWQATCFETLELINYSLSPVELFFTLQFDTDFADIFEVRGIKRRARGRRLADEVEADRVALGYEGLDGVVRRTDIAFFPAPEKLSPFEAQFHRILSPGKQQHFEITYAFAIDKRLPSRRSLSTALEEAQRATDSCKADECLVRTSNPEFNVWLDRSAADLHMMFTDTGCGLYPYAGVPWFSTPFGRDGILTALSFLWINDYVAKGVLQYLAAYQATQIIPEKDATPGKILHEARQGEMAALEEIPFGLYYGSTDATPLFVMLAGAYFGRTGDLEFIKSIWPQINAALEWIDNYGDVDGDGFVESVRQSSRGLVQQGWKDSSDSISHEDGTLPQGPIALCEVQAYVYGAKEAAARLANSLGQFGRASALLNEARSLREKFNESFWCEKLSTYAIALDQDKRPCQVVASNAGHCLFTGIASDEYARRIADTLLSDECFSGWGVRTLSTREVRYNPMSYHNGSVWPHDNAIVAAGLANYGFKEATNRILTGLFDASLSFDLHRLPELFCGFPRREGEGPTHYPAACAPQAWAAASVFSLLQACLGLSIDASRSRVTFAAPQLPPFIEEIHVKNLRVGQGSLDLEIDRDFRGIGVVRRDGDANIMLR